MRHRANCDKVLPMKSRATTVEQYLAELPEDRREPISAVRDAVNAALPEGYQEGMQYGMIGWFVPHSIYPPGYHCDPKQPVPFVSLASQKNHMSIYMMCLYYRPEANQEFLDAHKAQGKKIDMGKGCVRFKRMADLDLDLVAKAVSVPVDEYLASYQASRSR